MPVAAAPARPAGPRRRGGRAAPAASRPRSPPARAAVPAARHSPAVRPSASTASTTASAAASAQHQRRPDRAEQIGAGGQRIAGHQHAPAAPPGPAAVGQGMASPCGPGIAASTAAVHRQRGQQGGQPQRQVASPRCEPMPPGPGQQRHARQHAGDAEALQQQVGDHARRARRPGYAPAAPWRCSARGRAHRSEASATSSASAASARATARVPPTAAASPTAEPRRQTRPPAGGPERQRPCMQPRLRGDLARGMATIPHNRLARRSARRKKKALPVPRERALSGPKGDCSAERFRRAARYRALRAPPRWSPAGRCTTSTTSRMTASSRRVDQGAADRDRLAPRAAPGRRSSMPSGMVRCRRSAARRRTRRSAGRRRCRRCRARRTRPGCRRSRAGA